LLKNVLLKHQITSNQYRSSLVPEIHTYQFTSALIKLFQKTKRATLMPCQNANTNSRNYDETFSANAIIHQVGKINI